MKLKLTIAVLSLVLNVSSLSAWAQNVLAFTSTGHRSSSTVQSATCIPFIAAGIAASAGAVPECGLKNAVICGVMLPR